MKRKHLLLSFLFAFSSLHAQTTFVKSDATGAGNGTSWADAYTELADALNNSSAGDEIWVTAGTYLPGTSDTATFYLGNDVQLYGGFNGTETMLSERDPTTNVTILSGDLNGDDLPDDFVTNRADNVLHVVWVDSLVTAGLDGFTISGGHADGDDATLTNRGGGLFTYGVVDIENCIVEQNFSIRQGGAFYFRDMASSGSSVENCLFQKNRCANVAGGIGMWDTRDITILNCDFLQNEAGDFAGGAIAMAMSSASISGCDFIENSGTNNAGALFFDNFDATGLELSVTDCYFENNTAVRGGAFAFLSSGGGDCDILISGCEFTGNAAIAATSSVFSGGGALDFNHTEVNLSADTIRVLDCVFENNTARPFGGAILINDGAGTGHFFHVGSCDFTSNSAVETGGAYAYASNGNGANGLITDCTFTNNESNAAGAVVYQTLGKESNFTVRNCDFVGNKSTGTSTTSTGLVSGGGAVFLLFTSGLILPNNQATVDSCHFENNEAGLYGGGIFVLERSLNDSVSVLNSTFVSNEALYGAGTQASAEGENFKLQLSNCEYVENSALEFGGGFRAESADPNFQMSHDDCLFDGNIADIDGGGLEIVLFSDGNAETVITDTDFLNNTSSNQGAGLNFYLGDQASGSLTVDGALFSGNTNDDTGDPETGAGGFSLVNLGNSIAKVDFQSTTFENNSSEDGAGAINLFKIGLSTTDVVKLTNCLLNNNSGGIYGGGIGLFGAIDLKLTNNTIADNNNGGIVLTEGVLSMQNNILDNPSEDDFASVSTNNTVNSLGGNLIGDNTLDAFLNNTDQSGADPMFAAGTYQLSQNSPAVDAGILPDEPTDTDLAGNDRIQGGCIDIGALESPYDAGMDCLVTNAREVLADPSSIAIYPNPTLGHTNISIENEWVGELNLRITNALGQTVYKADFEKFDQTTVLEFDASNLPEGIYQVLVSDGEVLAVSSFVKI